ncbi:histidine kinase dimerization/phospho-acceptor domain-containing protein [Streptomyces sp. NPDC059456]|uniref:HAMP domain-containing sensor histidine kinase n=1 Tax=Streptomyces sp. NPDC059456 TaxID=3346838 RepID=UPI0036A5CC9F
MRARVVRVALVAAAVALFLLAVPLAVAVRSTFLADENGELERDAMATVVRVGPDFAAGDPVEPPGGRGEVRRGIYDATGRLRSGAGPAAGGDAVREALAGRVARTRSGGEFVVAVPVSSGERVVGAVRASTSARTVRSRVLWGWAALLGLCLLALGAAVVVARRQASVLSAPLEALARTSLAIADGDLTARADRSTIAEIDEVARAHNAMVGRLARLLERERHFTANASHQLRTPLTGLQLALEAAMADPDADARAALAEAAERSRHLDHTIDEVLRLATSGASTPEPASLQPVGDLLEAAERRWHGVLAGDGRRLELVREPASGRLTVPGRSTDQILDVLLDNAHRHGSGTVTVSLRDLGAALAVDVADEGSGVLDARAIFDRGTGTGSGIGLALARELAGASGARITLSGTGPTRFTLLLPLHGG